MTEQQAHTAPQTPPGNSIPPDPRQRAVGQAAYQARARSERAPMFVVQDDNGTYRIEAIPTQDERVTDIVWPSGTRVDLMAQRERDFQRQQR